MILALLLACTGKTDDSAVATTDTDADTDTDTDADADTDADTDTDPGTTVETDAGLYTLTYRPDPDPPSSGDTTLHMHLLHLGADLTGATVSVSPIMTSMGHGPPEPPVVTELGAGDYDATWNYSMGGRWDVTVGVTSGAGEDSVVLPFDVQ